MPTLILLFSHTLTEAQRADAFSTLNVTACRSLPEDLQARWSDIPPDVDEIAEYLRPVEEWLRAEAEPGDLVLVQGDFGAVYRFVTLALTLRLIPVYATTARQVIETPQPDGTIQVQRTFCHVRFRREQHFRSKGLCGCLRVKMELSFYFRPVERH